MTEGQKDMNGKIKVGMLALATLSLCGCGAIEKSHWKEDAKEITVYLGEKGFYYKEDWSCALWNVETNERIGYCLSMEEAEKIEGWTYAVAYSHTLEYACDVVDKRIDIRYGERRYRIDKIDGGYEETEQEAKSTLKRYVGAMWEINYDI